MKVRMRIDKIGDNDYKVVLDGDGVEFRKRKIYVRTKKDVVFLVNQILPVVNRKYKLMMFEDSSVKLVNLETSVSTPLNGYTDAFSIGKDIDEFTDALKDLLNFCIDISANDKLQEPIERREIELEVD